MNHVVYEKDGPIARIILDNPDRANAQTSEMVHSVTMRSTTRSTTTTSKS